MRVTSVLLLACLLIGVPRTWAHAGHDDESEPEVDEKDVVVLTDASFNNTLGKHKYALVEFYAPWCGHCKSLKGPYAEAATTLKAHDAGILLGKVDATVEKDLAKRFDVRGFPSLKWFVDGEAVMDYGAGRTAPEIVAWIKKRTGPPSTLVATTEALEAAKKEGDVLLAGYFSELEGPEHEAFEALASKTDDVAFVKVTDAALAKTLGMKAAPSFAVGRNYPGLDFEFTPSEGNAAMAGKAPMGDKLAAFLTAEKLPAFLEFSPATASRIFNSGVDRQVIVVAPADAFAPGAALRNEITAASAKTRGNVVWVASKVGSTESEPIVKYFGLDAEGKAPQVVGFQASDGKKYSFPPGDKVNAKQLVKFAEAVIAGTAPRVTKSAPVPAEPTEDGVTVVVGSTFETLVKDPTKDVLLEVYAPWCGHCKSLAPIYSKLAKRFAKTDSVVIAKMDGTENEHPDAEASGYPTLIFFPADKAAEPIKYEGDRSLKEMTKFIKANAKVAFELPKKKKEEAAAEDAEAEAEAQEEAANAEEAAADDEHDEL